MEVKIIGQMDNTLDNTFESANRVYDRNGLCPTILTYSGGGIQPKTLETNLRYGSVISSDGLARTITVEKDEGQKVCIKSNLKKSYKIRKLTPRECWRLMGFSDEDFEKAASVNSNTQLYKEAGNSICKPVLMAIFRQLNIKGVEKWNKE